MLTEADGPHGKSKSSLENLHGLFTSSCKGQQRRFNKEKQGAESEGSTYKTTCHMDRVVAGKENKQLTTRPLASSSGWKLANSHTPH